MAGLRGVGKRRGLTDLAKLRSLLAEIPDPSIGCTMSSQNNNLSDNYWNLHRNSLIASSLLFFSSAKIINIDEMQFWHINSNGRIVPFILFLASTYAFSVYIAVGRSQAQKRWRDEIESLMGEQKNLKSIISSINESIKIIEQMQIGCSNQIKDLVTKIESFLKEGENRQLPADPTSITYNEVNEINEICINHATKLANISNIGAISHERSQNQFWLQGLAGDLSGAVRKLVDKLARYTANDLKSPLLYEVDFCKKIIGENADQAKRSADALIATMKSVRSFDRNIQLKRFSNYISYGVIGWHVPAIVYSIGLMHFAGLYYSAFPSIIDVLRSGYLL